MTLGELPQLGLPSDVRQIVELIDVIWFAKGGSELACAFEWSRARRSIPGFSG